MNAQTRNTALNLNLDANPARLRARPLSRVLIAVAAAMALSGAARAQTAAASPEPQLMALAQTQSVTAAERTLSGLFAVSVREQIAGSARYPATREAFQLQPAGRVGLWVEIDRKGQLVDARVTAASAHKLLDAQALRDVRNVRYAAFPAGAYAGEASHRFLMTIDYAPAAR